MRVPDLVIIGSHCTGLDLVTAPMAHSGLVVRSISVGSLGGLAAAKRGECDLAPIHLFDEKSETYNTPYLTDGLELVPGWRRMQGIVFRKGDTRFEGLSAEAAVRAALTDAACIMVNRNQGAGTRILIDRLHLADKPHLVDFTALGAGVTPYASGGMIMSWTCAWTCVVESET